MKHKLLRNLVVVLPATLFSALGGQHPQYLEAVRLTSQMAANPAVQQMTHANGLHILNLTWEDTGRYKGSAVGPNISDMTIQVGVTNASGHFEVSCMPVIRFPNFSDKTCDLDPQDFTLLIGNERGKALKRLSLYDFLAEPRRYLSNPASWPGKADSLLAPRDTKVLVSAQACFLPVPKGQKATFNPVVFNYQSGARNPAVLTILATREGTSVTVIDNQRDAFAVRSVWGQRLFFNSNGRRAPLTGQRTSEFASRDEVSAPGLNTSDAKGETGLNMVLLVQVPLKHKEFAGVPAPGYGMAVLSMSEKAVRSDVESAVIGHGDEEGPFTEMDNLPVERDPRFPIRVTVQFYKATATGKPAEEDIAQIRRQIDRVYAQSDYVGSLVTAGETGRATEYEGLKTMPPDWWKRFWEYYEENSGESRSQAIARLQQILGRPCQECAVSHLYLSDLLRSRRI